MVTLFKSTATPIIWVLFSLIFALVLLNKSRRESLGKKIGWYFVFLGAIILLILSLRPVSNFLIYSLESRYRPATEAELTGLDAIVVLGGGIIPSGPLQRYPEPTSATFSRVYNAVRIFQETSAKTLVFCGLGLYSGRESEASVMKELAMQLGVSGEKIATEEKSRTTIENAMELKKMPFFRDAKRIGIVTSAIHMLRSQEAFERVFPQKVIVPIPVNYISSPINKYNPALFIPSAAAFSASTHALHEWIGRIWYLLRYYLNPGIKK